MGHDFTFGTPTYKNLPSRRELVPLPRGNHESGVAVIRVFRMRGCKFS